MCNKNYIVLLKSFELKKNTYKEVTTFFLHFLKRYMGRGGGKNEPALNPPLYAAMCLVTLQKISNDTPPRPLQANTYTFVTQSQPTPPSLEKKILDPPMYRYCADK